jgi:signal peptidase I
MGKRSAGAKAGGQAAAKAIIGALITALIMKLFMFDFMIAEGHSMEPSIKPGKILVVFKMTYGLRIPVTGTYLLRWASPCEGDIVVFYTPLGEIAVKRCGELIPGDYFYALGDNSTQSYDSRSYGPVLIENIVGKVLGVR